MNRAVSFLSASSVSTWALLIFGARWFFVVRDCPAPYRLLSNMPDLYALDATPQLVPKSWQSLPGWEPLSVKSRVPVPGTLSPALGSCPLSSALVCYTINGRTPPICQDTVTVFLVVIPELTRRNFLITHVVPKLEWSVWNRRMLQDIVFNYTVLRKFHMNLKKKKTPNSSYLTITHV